MVLETLKEFIAGITGTSSEKVEQESKTLVDCLSGQKKTDESLNLQTDKGESLKKESLKNEGHQINLVHNNAKNMFCKLTGFKKSVENPSPSTSERESEEEMKKKLDEEIMQLMMIM